GPHSILSYSLLYHPLVPGSVVPVCLTEQHHAQAVRVQLAALHEDLQSVVVMPFRRVVGSLLIVGIGASLEQEARQLGMVRDPGGAVQRALPLGAGLMIGLIPPGIRVGPGIEPRLRGPPETLPAGA